MNLESLSILAVGPGVDPDALERLSRDVAVRLPVNCVVWTDTLDPSFALDAARGQYYSTALLERLSRTDGGERVLGVAAVDLFVPILTFVFGEAQLCGRAAVVSWSRLRERFYGLRPQPELEHERMVKEAVHELGHTYGLRHCGDWRCVMSSSHDVGRIDVKGTDFCAECKNAILRRPVGAG